MTALQSHKVQHVTAGDSSVDVVGELFSLGQSRLYGALLPTKMASFPDCFACLAREL
jgi:hypothetical protein